MTKIDLTNEQVKERECIKCRGVQPHWIVRRYARCLNCELLTLELGEE